MTSRASVRAFARASRAAAPIRSFHASRPAFITQGDRLPSHPLVEDTPGNKVDLGLEFKGKKGLVIGVPGAFTPGCSGKHIPSYIKHPKLKEAGHVFVVAVNDPFVMKAWGESLGGKQVGIRFLGDPTATFTKALDMTLDGGDTFGGLRSKRYALVINDGQVESVFVEPDNTGIKETMADKVLG